MKKDLLEHTITIFENYLIETDSLFDILTDICDNADLTDQTAAKVILLCDIFKEKNQKIRESMRYK